MSLIEQAAQRLEQLRQAGVTMPSASVDRVGESEIEPHSPVRREVASKAADGSGESVLPSPAIAISRRVDLDMKTLSAAGIISPDVPRSTLAEEFRLIKRPLIDNAMGKGPTQIKDGNLIMVTSALPSEGKTFTASNLAMSIAMELNNTVMLVDADVARPNLLKVMGLPPSRGLMDLLVDDSVDLAQVLLRTNVEKLTILPSGTPHPRATELLASDAMIRLLEDMANRYSDRIIIFDSPPLLVTTEARTLASHMGQVVIVVKAEGTSRTDVMHALATLETCPVKLMLLNQANTTAMDRYGYGYSYGYGN
jgi:protein-tyrosine kinase